MEKIEAQASGKIARALAEEIRTGCFKLEAVDAVIDGAIGDGPLSLDGAHIVCREAISRLYDMI